MAGNLLSRTPRAAASALAAMLAVAALLGDVGTARAQMPDATPLPEEAEPQAGSESALPAPDDPTVTAGGALRLFMVSRDYRTLKRLKSVMTERLQARFDHDSAPFNGKRGNRLAAFDFTEKDLKPRRSQGKGDTAATTYLASARSLWEEQGEATEKRTETVTLSRQDDGSWRVSNLAVASAEKIKFGEAVNGVTVLRMVLRAWHRGDAAAARANMSDAFLKKSQKTEALAARFTPPVGRRHAAYQIVQMTPQGATIAVARVQLYTTIVGEPTPIEGESHTLKMIKKGQHWLLDGWD